METLNKKILIVEDDEDFSYILEKKFTSEGFAIIRAKDGQEGIDMVEKENPDLIFSDMLMPKMDGISMAKKIRETNKNIPIIFLTNTKSAEHEEEIKDAGGFDYLVKSDIRIDDIVAKAKEKLGLS